MQSDEPIIRENCIKLLNTFNRRLQQETVELLRDVQQVSLENGSQQSDDVIKKALVTFLVELCGYKEEEWNKLTNQQLLERAKTRASHFLKKSSVRDGSENDVELLFKTFAGFGYDVKKYENLEAEELRQTLKDLSKEKDSNGESIFKHYASLVVCIMSHGSLGTICCPDKNWEVDGRPFKQLNVLELQYESFNSETCPDLDDKPKIFIIQACQGDIGQRMIPFDPAIDDVVRNNVNFYSPPLNPGIVYFRLLRILVVTKRVFDFIFKKGPLSVNEATFGVNQPELPPSPNTNNIKAQFRDVITLWSTIEGFVSHRHTQRGSAFIQSLCKQLNDFGGRRSRDLYEAHLDVTQEVTDRMFSAKFPFPSTEQPAAYRFNQTPLYKSTATRKVAFKKIN